MTGAGPARSKRRGRIDELEDPAARAQAAARGEADPVLVAPPNERAFNALPNYYRGQVARWGFAERGVVADVGSGFGRWSVFLAEVNAAVRGYDRSPERVAFARRLAAHFDLPNASFDVADVTALPAPDESFDGAWCFNVMPFVNRARTLKEIHRILKPGGPFLLGDYNALGHVLKKFFDGYAVGGVEDRNASFALRLLMQDPMLSDAPQGYGSPRHIEAILRQFGFELSGREPIELTMAPDPPNSNPFEEDMGDLPALARRLQSDAGFARAFASHPQVAARYPMWLTVRATKVG